MRKISLILWLVVLHIADMQAQTDSLSIRTGMTDWVDPVMVTPVNTHYVVYPTPSRGEGTEGQLYGISSCRL